MQQIKQTLVIKSYFSLIILSFILLLSSCATKVPFTTSSVVPAAEGTVKVKKDNNNNYTIELKIKRLADPKRLNPSREVYVVWMDTEQGRAKNIGQLTTSSGFLSGTLKSSLKSVSAFKPSRIFVTAEDKADIQFPIGQQVLMTKNF